MGQNQSNFAPQHTHQQPPQAPSHTCTGFQQLQQPSPTANPGQQHLQQTEAELDQQLRQMKKRKRYDDFTQVSKSVRFSQPLEADEVPQKTDQLPQETVDPARLRHQPAVPEQVESVQTEDAALMLQKQSNQMSGHGHPHFSHTAIPNDKSIPPQQQQASSRPLHQFPYPDGTYPPPPQGLHRGHYQPLQPDQDDPNSEFAGLEAVQDTLSEDGIPMYYWPPQWMAQLNKTYTKPDLDSAQQTEQPDFHFPIEGADDPPALTLAGSRYRRGQGGDETQGETTAFPGPVTLLHTPDVAEFCRVTKCFMLEMFGNTWFGRPGILRMECLDLWKLEKGREGYVLLAQEACRVSFPVKEGVTREAFEVGTGLDAKEVRLNLYGRKWLDATLFAVLTPKEGRAVGKGVGGLKSMFAWENDVRFFWCVLPISPVLRMLADRNLTVVNDFQPGTRKHRQLTTWLRESFLKAVTIPDSADWTNALLQTDCCRTIIDPDNALHRLQTNEFLYHAFKDPTSYGRDLSDDRYRLKLHPAEREAASLANLKCAQYLFIKRSFFKSFYEDIYRSEKDIDPLASNTVSGRGVRQQPQQVRRPAPSGADEVDDSHDRRDREDTPMSTVTATTATGATPASAASVYSQRGTQGATARRVRVRTETAHQRWLESTYEIRARRAKCLVTCWREFGFLDESRYLDWVRAGGMFEDAAVGEPDEDEE